MLGCGAGGACSLSLFFSSLFLCQSCIPSLLFPFSLLFALSCTPLLQVAPSIPLSTPWHVFSICLFIQLPVPASLSSLSFPVCFFFFFQLMPVCVSCCTNCCCCSLPFFSIFCCMSISLSLSVCPANLSLVLALPPLSHSP